MASTPLPLLLEPESLAQMLNDLDKNFCIVDLSSRPHYLRGHIRGAIHLPFQALVLGRGPAPGQLPRREQLLEVFTYLGLEDDTHFIVCDDEGGGWAGRFIWTLDMISHPRYSYVNGGMIAWKSLALPVETGEPSKSAVVESIPPITINEQPRARLEDILAQLDRQEWLIWDARSPQEYNGLRVTASKNGHIPGAVNVEWTELMSPADHYQIRKDAKAYLAQRGIDGSRPIVTHCQTHHRSGFTYLLGRILGYEIKAYDGSWSEWGNHPDTPVEV